jgi:hypothetical protein
MEVINSPRASLTLARHERVSAFAFDAFARIPRKISSDSGKTNLPVAKSKGDEEPGSEHQNTVGNRAHGGSRERGTLAYD